MNDLDLMATGEVVGAVLDGQDGVLPAVRRAVPQIAAAADLIAQRLRAGGRLVLVGAGTSGRLAVLQAAELPGTFGLAAGLVQGRTAGGGSGGLTGCDADEDDVDAGRRDAAELGLNANDALVAVAASGRTPYTLAVADLAARVGAAVVSVTTTVPSPLAARADVAIEVPIGAEALRGSTRLAAGTAQKLTLDALTTAAMVRFGRVHADLMVDMVAANEKLRDRSAGIVAEIAETTVDAARDALVACDWNARAAVLHLVADLKPDEAAAVAARHDTLRQAMHSQRVST
jgi:N-acetylmuramic acid 6-phosphate etherase